MSWIRADDADLFRKKGTSRRAFITLGQRSLWKLARAAGGDTARAATTGEVQELRCEVCALTLENRMRKKE
jgi:transposase